MYEWKSLALAKSAHKMLLILLRKYGECVGGCWAMMGADVEVWVAVLVCCKGSMGWCWKCSGGCWENVSCSWKSIVACCGSWAVFVKEKVAVVELCVCWGSLGGWWGNMWRLRKYRLLFISKWQWVLVWSTGVCVVASDWWNGLGACGYFFAMHFIW